MQHVENSESTVVRVSRTHLRKEMIVAQEKRERILASKDNQK